MNPTTAPSNPVPSPEPALQISPQITATPPVGLPSTPSDVITPNSVTKVSKPFTPVLIGLLLVILIAVAGYFGYKFYMKSNIPAPQAAVYTPPIASASPTPNASDNSDAALAQDAKSLDTSLGAVDSELTNVDQGMTDQEGDLSGN